MQSPIEIIFPLVTENSPAPVKGGEEVVPQADAAETREDGSSERKLAEEPASVPQQPKLNILEILKVCQRHARHAYYLA